MGLKDKQQIAAKVQQISNGRTLAGDLEGKVIEFKESEGLC